MATLNVMSDTVMYWNGFITVGVLGILIFWWYKQYFQTVEVPFGAHEIVSNLWLGSFEDSLKLEELRKRNIKRVLSVTFGTYPIFPDEFDYLFVRCMDEEHQHIGSYFDEAIHFIEEARAAGEGVFVHCMQGISRSSSFVTAYLISRGFKKEELLGQGGDGEDSESQSLIEEDEGGEQSESSDEVFFGLEDALGLIKSKRARVNPNAGFLLQLQQYEQIRKGSEGADKSETLRELRFEQTGEEGTNDETNDKRIWKAELYRYSKATQEMLCINPHELQDFVERSRAFVFHAFLRFYNFHFRRFHRYLKNKSPKHERQEQKKQEAWARAKKGRRGTRRYPLSDQDDEEAEERKRSLFFSK